MQNILKQGMQGRFPFWGQTTPLPAHYSSSRSPADTWKSSRPTVKCSSSPPCKLLSLGTKARCHLLITSASKSCQHHLWISLLCFLLCPWPYLKGYRLRTSLLGFSLIQSQSPHQYQIKHKTLTCSWNVSSDFIITILLLLYKEYKMYHFCHILESLYLGGSKERKQQLSTFLKSKQKQSEFRKESKTWLYV